MKDKFSIENLINRSINESIFENDEDVPKYDPYSDPNNQIKYFHDPKVRYGDEWAKYGGNFAVERNGRQYYVSRSVAVSMYTYCRNKRGEWCVLANKRGSGAPNASGLWNVVCGFLDYNETAEAAARRETYEETGVNIPYNKIQMMGVNSGNGVDRTIKSSYSDPNAKVGELGKNTPVRSSQNVTIRFAAVLDGVTDNYPIDISNCEPGEVDDCKWIPLREINKYHWAYGMSAKIIPQAQTLLGQKLKGGDNLNTLVYDLKREIGGNPKAMYLLKQILKHVK